MKNCYDAIVLGGGLYGCKIALALRSQGMKKVLLLEPNEIAGGATTVNQNRVHGGYHYPRSIQTAMSAQRNYTRFLADHAPAIEPNREHIYVIAEGSKTSPAEFERVMREVGAPLTPIETPHYFAPGMVQRVYQVEEVAFNIKKMSRFLEAQMYMSGVERLYYSGHIMRVDEHGVTVELGWPHDISRELIQLCDGAWITADYVFNCTYGNIDEVGAHVRTKLQKEMCEVALIHPPSILMRTDITILDGPFWSLMAYPGNQCHALTHVEYTVHDRWFPPDHPLPAQRKRISRCGDMIADAARFVPAMRATTHVSSLYTTRVVLAENESDDGRPILWEYDDRSPRVISVLGSKFNSVYDAIDMVNRGEWRQPEHKRNVRAEGRRALIGRGFVGSNLNKPGRFTDFYHSKNVQEMQGHYQQIVIAAPSAEKWRVEADPGADFLSIERMLHSLRSVTADDVMLISTIDVHGSTRYGENRGYLERSLRNIWPHSRVIRLPALYGPGLKKNALYDLLNPDSFTVPTNATDMYQWYDVRNLWRDIQEVLPSDTVDIVPAPVSMEWIAQQIGVSLDTFLEVPVHYDYRTSEGGYTETEEQVKDGLKKFIEEYRA